MYAGILLLDSFYLGVPNFEGLICIDFSTKRLYTFFQELFGSGGYKRGVHTH